MLCYFKTLKKERFKYIIHILAHTFYSIYCTGFFFFFWLHWVFIAAVGGLSVVAVSGGYSSLWCAGATLPCGARASHCSGFSCCRAWALGAQASVVVARGLSSCGSQAQQLWRMGLVALRHVGSSQTRAQTRVPCSGRRIFNRYATREAPVLDVLSILIIIKILTKTDGIHFLVILRMNHSHNFAHNSILYLLQVFKPYINPSLI